MSETAKRRRFELRRRRLRELVDGQFEGNAAAFARAIDTRASYVTNLLGGKKNLGEDAVARICERLGLAATWFDAPVTREVGAPSPRVMGLARRIATLGEPWRAAALAIVKIGESARFAGGKRKR